MMIPTEVLTLKSHAPTSNAAFLSALLTVEAVLLPLAILLKAMFSPSLSLDLSPQLALPPTNSNAAFTKEPNAGLLTPHCKSLTVTNTISRDPNVLGCFFCKQ